MGEDGQTLHAVIIVKDVALSGIAPTRGMMDSPGQF